MEEKDKLLEIQSEARSQTDGNNTEFESKSRQESEMGQRPSKAIRRPQKMKDTLDQITLEQYIMLRDFDSIVRLVEKQPKQYIEFQKLKYQDTVYSIGDNLLMSYFKNFQKIDQIGRIKKIISVMSYTDDAQLPIIIMNWYCNKEDIAIQYKDYKNCFSAYELFLTDVSTALFVDSIVNSVNVLCYEEYETQSQSNEQKVYYTRAAYNTFQENLVPHPREWPVTCICNMPPNPDLSYVFCEKCHQWIHLTCARLTQEEADKIEIYICKRCRN